MNKVFSFSHDQEPAERAYSVAGSSESGDREPSSPRKNLVMRKRKGTLKLEDLIEAKKQFKAAKDNTEMTEEEKKAEKRAANRLSAFQSRQRRQIIIRELRKTVAQISKDNSAQREEVAQLKIEHERILEENECLREQLAAERSNRANIVPIVAPPVAAPQPDILTLLQELAKVENQITGIRPEPCPFRVPQPPTTTASLASLWEQLQGKR